MEIKKLSDEEIALRALDYIKRLDDLKEEIRFYVDGKSELSEEEIKGNYKKLKAEIKEEAHYMGLNKNQIERKTNIYYTYGSNVREAAAYGFSSSTNGRVNMEMWHSVEEAHYKMGKHYNWDEIIKK